MLNRIACWFRGRILRRRGLNPTRIVAASFGVIILVGGLLLALPISARDAQATNFLDCLFTATSATCVTGLIPLDTWLHWSFFGQLVIIVLIQLGGLGFMTVITIFSFVLHRRIGLSERLIMVSTLNLNDMDGVVRVVRHALIGTFALEGAGAVLLSIRFIPQFGWAGGIWRGIFHAISAFCNAGFDLMGGKFGAFTNVEGYNADPYVLGILMCLIVVGGLGFFVWEDLVRARSWKRLSLYSKMVLVLTGSLLLGGAAFFFFAEYANPATLGDMPFWQKLLNAMTLALILLFLFLVGSMTISLVDGVPYLSAAFETASALGTVGVSAGITPELSAFSHVILMCMMYLGRVGVFSVSVAFMARNRGVSKIQYPNVDIMIG